MNNQDFYTRVKDLCKARGISISELTEKIGLSRPQVYQNWKSRDILPSVDYCLFIARALNTSVEFLITGIDTESKYKESLENIREIINKTI